MPRSTKRATTRDLDILHRLVVRGLVDEMRRIKRAKEPLSAALLNAASKVLALTGTTFGERETGGEDRLAGLLKDYESDRDDLPPEVDLTRTPAPPAATERDTPSGLSLVHPLVDLDHAMGKHRAN